MDDTSRTWLCTAHAQLQGGNVVVKVFRQAAQVAIAHRARAKGGWAGGERQTQATASVVPLDIKAAHIGRRQFGTIQASSAVGPEHERRCTVCPALCC